MKAPARDDQAKAGAVFEQGELFERYFTAMFPNPDSQAGIALASMAARRIFAPIKLAPYRLATCCRH
jgi:hypothetical protein